MDVSERSRTLGQLACQMAMSGFLMAGGLYLIRVALDLPAPSLPGAIGPASFPVMALGALVAASLWLFVTGLVQFTRAHRRTAQENGSQTPRAKTGPGAVAYGRTGQPGPKGGAAVRWPKWVRVPVVLASLFAYAGLWQRAGFVVTSLVFVSVTSAMLTPVERRSWLKSTIVALAVTGVIYGLFQELLKVPLPGWSWG